MSSGEEDLILSWLERIEETDPATIDYVLSKCRTDADALAYFLMRASDGE